MPKSKRAAIATASGESTSGPPLRRAWYEDLYSGAMSPEYKAYMANEWGHPKRGDRALFEKLSLEGAQAGLSWATILAKREAYRKAFHGFDIAKCAAMTQDDIDRLVAGDGSSGRSSIVKHRGKIESVVNNARCLQLLDASCGTQVVAHGHFDAFIWSFVHGKSVVNEWPDAKSIPSETETSHAMSKALKKLGFAFVGPKCCYSLMQSCGLVIDHPRGTPEWIVAKQRSEADDNSDPASVDSDPTSHEAAQKVARPLVSEPAKKRSRRK